MSSAENKEKLVATLLVLLAWPFHAIWAGFVLTIIWGWFIVDTFGLPNLSIPIAIGLTSVVRTIAVPMNIAMREPDTSKSPAVQGITALVAGFVHPAAILAFCWVVYQFGGK